MADKKVYICVIALVLVCVSVCLCACGKYSFDGSLNGFYEQNGTEDKNANEYTDGENINNSVEDTLDEENCMKICIIAGNKCFDAVLYDVKAAKEFYSMLPLTMDMSAMQHEKYFYLNRTLTSEPKRVGNIEEGDVMLWGNNCIVLFYESFFSNYSYTKLGKTENTQGFAEALGQGEVTVTVTRA